MNEHVVERVFSVRRHVAAALLAVGLIAHPVAWSLDPYVWGVTLLLLAPLQIAVAVLGVVARLWRDRKDATLSWLVDGLLLAMSLAGYAFARTISWT